MNGLLWIVIICTAYKTIHAVQKNSVCDISSDMDVCIISDGDSEQETRCSDSICTKINKTNEFSCKKIPDAKNKTANVYPVLWNDNLLFVNENMVFELQNSSLKVSNNHRIAMDNLTRLCYLKTMEMSAEPQKGFMAGGVRIEITIKINQIYKELSLVMEPMNKTCKKENTNTPGKIYCISPEVKSKKANLTFISNYVKYFKPFEYLENPDVELTGSNSSYYWGGRLLTFKMKNTPDIHSAEILSSNFSDVGDHGSLQLPVSFSLQASNCSLKSKKIECFSPNISIQNNVSNSSIEIPVVLQLDTYKENVTIVYYPDPEFEEKASIKDKVIKIKGKRLNNAAEKEEYKIIAGTENCTIEILKNDLITCKIQTENFEGSVNVTLHSKTQTLTLEKISNYNFLFYLLLIPVAAILAISIFGIWYKSNGRRKSRTFDYTDDYTGQVISLIVRQGIPFQKPSDYIKRILWTHKPPGNMRYDNETIYQDLKQNLDKFGHLLKNKFFLLPTLKALEKDKSLTLDQKFICSFHLSILFSSDLRYFLELCEDLFVHLASQIKGAKKKKLMWSCSSITEYMILNWFGVTMYSFMKENIGDILYFFIYDLKSHLEKMPIDEVTGNAYQYLFEKYRLKMNTKYEEIQIQAQMGREIEMVSVFTCDSIVQLKKKCIAAFYRGQTASEIPDIDDVCVEYNGIRIEEFKEENSTNFTQHLTIDNWNIQEDDLLKLTISKVPQVTEANADDRYVTLGASVDRITTKSKRKFIHLEEPLNQKTEQPLTNMDLKKINLPANLEHKLLQFTRKFLDSKKLSAPHRCLYNLFKKAAKKTGEEKTWMMNACCMQFCCQFIAEPNILLDINLELFMKKNLEGIKNYAVSTMESCLKDQCKDLELSRNIKNFLSGFSEVKDDVQEQMSTLQSISNDIVRDVKFCKENSLYYIFKLMKNNYMLIKSALMKEEKACRLQLSENFLSIIEHIEIGQTKRDDNFLS